MDSQDKILLANVGNRNVVFDTNGEIKSIVESKNYDGTFREASQELLDDIKEDKSFLEELRLVILNQILAKVEGQIIKVYLFISDQKNADISTSNSYQDTLYAGEIVKLLMERDYPNIEVKLIKLECSVVSHDKLTRLYRKNLKELLETHTEEAFVICDTGGTPQQKASLKICAEFLIPEDKVEYWQVIEQRNANGDYELGKDGTAKPQDRDEYKKIMNAQQIELLIRKGNYQAAYEIYGDLSPKRKKDKIFANLRGLHLRISGLLAYSIKYLIDEKGYKGRKKRDLIYVNRLLVEEKPICDFTPDFKDDFIKEDFIKITERLSIAQFYLEQKDYTNVVLNYQIFAENFLNKLISKAINSNIEEQSFFYSGELNRSEIRNQLITELPQNFHNRNGCNQDLRSGIPTNIVYAQKVLNISPTSSQVIDEFRKLFLFNSSSNSFRGLQKLRNKIAHDGKGVKGLKEINNIIEVVPPHSFIDITNNIHQLFNMPSQNIYLQANEELMNILKID